MENIRYINYGKKVLDFICSKFEKNSNKSSEDFFAYLPISDTNDKTGFTFPIFEYVDDDNSKLVGLQRYDLKSQTFGRSISVDNESLYDNDFFEFEGEDSVLLEKFSEIFVYMKNHVNDVVYRENLEKMVMRYDKDYSSSRLYKIYNGEKLEDSYDDIPEFDEEDLDEPLFIGENKADLDSLDFGMGTGVKIFPVEEDEIDDSSEVNVVEVNDNVVNLETGEIVSGNVSKDDVVIDEVKVVDEVSFEDKKKEKMVEKKYDSTGTIKRMYKELVGMDRLKEEIKEFENYVKFLKTAKQQGLTLPLQNMNMVFTGNPGTGKRSVARLFTEMLFDAGVIRENKFVDVEREDFVGEYSGQAVYKTYEIVERARGGVLYIDKPYLIISKEAIMTIVKAMKDLEGDFYIIFSGRLLEMEDFLKTNTSIASRIGYVFNFPNCTDRDYCEIFSRKVYGSGMEIENEALEAVGVLMKYFSNVKNIENGRFVDKVFQETLNKHVKNGSRNIKMINVEDIPTIDEIKDNVFNGNMIINVEDVSEKSMRRKAVHEVGHAFLRFLLTPENQMNRVVLKEEEVSILGYIHYAPDLDFETHSKMDFTNEIIVLLGGMVAEEAFLGDFNNGNVDDLSRATSIAKKMVIQYGMSSLGYGQIDNPNGELSVMVYQEINKILKDCFKNAMDIMRQNKKTIENAIDFLVKNREITKEDFEKIFEG